MLVQFILAFIIIAIILQIFNAFNRIIDSPVIEVEQSDFESKYKDLPNVWYSNGICIESWHGQLVTAPIYKECIELSKANIIHHADAITIVVQELLTDNEIMISVDYAELQQHSKESVIQYLFDRKIII